MKKMTVLKVLAVLIGVLAIGSMVGCARIAGVAKDDYRDGKYYPVCLVDMDRALSDARAAGKDKECPDEYNALKDMADRAVKTHLACNTDGACKMAQDVATKARNITCPPKPVAIVAPIVPPPPPPRYKYCTKINPEFDICSAEIRPQYRDVMTRAGKFLQQYPDTTAVVQGHTDNVPITPGPSCKYKDNMELSQARAQSVVDYLVNNYSIDSSRLTAKGYGDTSPVADNDTVEGRQKNRRVDAIVDCAILPAQIAPEESICMTLNIEFDTDKTDIKPDYDGEIAKVANFMKDNPTVTALVEGHTDNVGSPEHNLKLSQMRAESVVNYLADKFGIDRSRLSAKGFGETRRVTYNRTPEARAQNRRVEVILDCVLKK